MSRATFAARFVTRLVLAALVAGALLVHASAAHASDPEQKCLQGRYKAAAKYAACQQKALAKFFGGGSNADVAAAVLKCRVKYTAVWAKLQTKASGTGATCDNARFADNGDGTVTDRLTALQWEKKDNLDNTQNFADPHDGDNVYTWSATGTAADGAAFTSFLAALNGGGCFAGQCDWRLPTIYELQTVLLEPYPCTTSPCIDPIFGPTRGFNYWSATTNATNPSDAWFVDFGNGLVAYFDNKGSNVYVRAVRAGL